MAKQMGVGWFGLKAALLAGRGHPDLVLLARGHARFRLQPVFWVMIFKTWLPFLVIVKDHYLRKPSFLRVRRFSCLLVLPRPS